MCIRDRYGILLGLFAKFTFTDAPDNLGFVVGLSICASMIVAATVGTIIPLILRKLDIDPAIATTICNNKHRYLRRVILLSYSWCILKNLEWNFFYCLEQVHITASLL